MRSTILGICGNWAKRLRLAFLFLVFSFTYASAEVTCSQASDLLLEVATTSHHLHVANNARRAGRTKQLLNIALARLNGHRFSTLLAEQPSQAPRAAHSSFVRLHQQLALFNAADDTAASGTFLENRIGPMLPQLINAFSQSMDCDFLHLNSELERLPGASPASSAPLPLESTGASQDTSTAHGRRGRGGFMQFLGDNFAGGILFSLTLLCTVALVVVDRIDRRKAPRFDISFSTQIIHAGITRKIRILNIGPGGAKIKPGYWLKVDDDVEVIINGRTTAANVRWTSETSAGVAFANPLKQHELDLLSTTST